MNHKRKKKILINKQKIIDSINKDIEKVDSNISKLKNKKIELLLQRKNLLQNNNIKKINKKEDGKKNLLQQAGDLINKL